MDPYKKPYVTFVGAGPGDPELLTLKGMRALQSADVVVYDQLANNVLLSMARPDAEMIDVGKHAGHHTLPQDDINALLYEKAMTGRKVVRFKGGDPFVFGRGGEEASYLQERGVGCEIIPGVTSPVAVPAYAGIPVTHRDLTQTVTFVTGHEKEGADRIPWEQLAKIHGTIVFLMGLGNLENIVERMQKHGASADTPVAVIENGTHNDQRTVTAPMGEIVKAVRSKELRPPALIVMGEVVRLREELQWFEHRPLFGKRVLVTKEAFGAKEMEEQLFQAGAIPVSCPLIRIEPLEDGLNLLKEILEKEEHYDWLVLTSPAGVRLFAETLQRAKKDARVLAGTKIAAIGEKTAQTLMSYGLIADCVPGEYRAEALAKEMIARMSGPCSILLPRAKKARPELYDLLKAEGCELTQIGIYDTLPNPDAEEILRKELPTADILTFASASAVDAFFALTKDFFCADQGGGKQPLIAAIGPVTASAIEKYGVTADIVPSQYTTEYLINAICEREGVL